MTATGKKHLLTVLNYPGAGHLIEPPFSPHCTVARLNKKSMSCSVMPRESSAFPFVNTWHTHGGMCVFVSVILVHGGKTKPHSDAQEDAWSKILAYLRHHLYFTPWDSMVKNSATEHLSSHWLWPSHLPMFETQQPQDTAKIRCWTFESHQHVFFMLFTF